MYALVSHVEHKHDGVFGDLLNIYATLEEAQEALNKEANAWRGGWARHSFSPSYREKNAERLKERRRLPGHLDQEMTFDLVIRGHGDLEYHVEHIGAREYEHPTGYIEVWF